MIFENHCCSSEVKRQVLLECKLFRLSKSAGDGANQGKKQACLSQG